MRAARTGKESTGFFRIGEASEVGGLVLGGDYCAEHESGIEELRREFGISSKAPPGIERYRISGLSSRSALVFCDRPDLDQSILCCSHPSNVSQLVGKPGITGGLATRHEGFDIVVADRVVAFLPTWRDKDDRVRVLPVHSKAADREAWKAYNAGIIGAWSERSFMVRALGEEARRDLEAVYNAFLGCDIALSTTRALTPFGRGGLAIVIASRIQPADLDRLREQDEDRDLLDATFKATGLPARFTERRGTDPLFGPNAKPAYFGIRPTWTREFIERRKADPAARPTEDDLTVWLNPMEQRHHNFGWFSVDALRRWFDGEGPVVKAWVEQQRVGFPDQPAPDGLPPGCG